MKPLKSLQSLTSAWEEPGFTLERVRLHALIAVFIYLLVFLPYAVIQQIGFTFLADETIIDPTNKVASMLTNVIMVGYSVIFLIVNYFPDGFKLVKPKKIFLPSFILGLFFIFAGWLAHTHFAGSLSSVVPAYSLFVFLILSWIFPWRYSVIFIVVAWLGLLGLIALEAMDVLPYAALLANGDQLGDIFLDWRAILLNLIIFGVMSFIVVVTTYSFKRTLERHAEKLKITNTALNEEIDRHKVTMVEKQNAIEELEQALLDVKTLKGLLPICASCKKIRDDKGYWTQLEQYVTEHSSAEFTHGICPTCIDELYPEYKDKEKE